MKFVVADTGPLLHLYEVGAFELLPQMAEIHVPPKVWEEFLAHVPHFPTRSVPTWLFLVELSPMSRRQAAHWVESKDLHGGEAEALAYCLETNAEMLLTDDSAARAFTEAVGIQVRGSLGIILYAAASGHLTHSEAMTILTNLEQRSSLWLSGKVKQHARQALNIIFGV